MPYHNKTITHNLMHEATQDPFGPCFTREQAAGAVKMEIWSSCFSDPGPDYNLFKLFDAQGALLHEKRKEGY